MRPTWQMVLLDPPNPQQKLPSFLIRSQMAASNFVLIIEDLTTSQSKTNIYCFWSGSLWIDWSKHGSLPNLTSPVLTTGWEFAKEMSGKLLSGPDTDTLNIMWYLLDWSTLRQHSKAISIRSLQKNSISSSLCIWMIFSFISKAKKKATSKQYIGSLTSYGNSCYMPI